MSSCSTIEGIKGACKKHFSPSLECKGLSCDVLASEQGPSCHSMKHISDLKVIHIRFIKSSSTPDSRSIANDYNSSSSRQQCFSEPVTPLRQNWQDPNKAQRTGSPNAKHVIPSVKKGVGRQLTTFTSCQNAACSSNVSFFCDG